MTLLEDLHQQHKDRIARMGGLAPTLPPVVPAKVKIQPEINSRNSRIDKMLAQFESTLAEVASLKRQLQEHSAIVGKLITTESDEKPRFHEIIAAVCEYYNITQNDLMSARRTGELVMPRQIICYLGRNLTGMSFPQMGRRLGGRDHTTALHGANKIHALLQKDEILADDISVLELKIGAKVMERRFGSNVVPIT